MKKIPKKNALILLSGGQDSTTCLAWAKEKFDKVFAITFDYGQRHKIELNAAKKIAQITKTPLRIQKLSLLKELTKNALTDPQIKINKGSKKNLPSTFVPGRNLIFIATAAIYAESLKITDIITGVCQTDYSGYPDCRDKFIKSLQKTLRLAMETPFNIHTPLMWISKKESVQMMQKLDKIELLQYSHTCYLGQRPACEKCPACKLRLKGFKEAGIEDPLKYRHEK